MSFKRNRDLPVLFAGDHIRVVCDHLDRPRTLITFTAWNKRGPMDRGLAEAAGMGYVGFIARQNHWWQTTELPQALQVVAGHLTQGQDITIFGSSMGGAGALLAAQFMPVSTVLAVAPPIIVDRQHAPWETRFQNVAHLTRQIHALGPNANPATRTYVVYDPFFRDDVDHLQLLDVAGRSYVRWPVPFSDHTPMVDVSKAGLYRDFTSAFFIRRDMDAARAILRQARARRGLIQLRWLQRRRYPRARQLQPEYVTDLGLLIDRHGLQPELLLERGLSLMHQQRPDLALPDFQKLQQFEDRRRFRNLVERAQTAIAAQA